MAWATMAAAGAIMGSSVAEAAVITYSVPLTVYEDQFRNGIDRYFPQFDSNLGTLISVFKSLVGTFTPTILVEYDASVLPPVTLDSYVALIGVGSNSLSEPALFVPSPYGQVAAGAPEDVDIAGTFPPSAGFIGGSPIGVDLYLIGYTGQVDNGFGGGALDRSTGNLVLSLSYTYVPVPEPGSLALLGAGLLVLGAVRLRETRMRRGTLGQGGKALRWQGAESQGSGINR